MAEERIEEKEIHLRDYIRIVRKRKSTVATFFAVVFVVVLIASFTATPEYNAATKVLIEKNEPSRALLANYAYSAYDPEFLETQSHIIKSVPVAEKVVRLLNLENTYDTFMSQHGGGSLLSPVKGLIKGAIKAVTNLFGSSTTEASMQGGGKSANGKSKKDQLSKLISTGLVVSPVPESRIVTINFTSPNPEVATMVTNSVAKAYIEQILDMRMQSSGYSIGWMTEKAEEERKRLESSEAALQQYMKDKDIVTIEDRITILPQKLSELSKELTLVQTRREELEAVFRKVQSITRNSEDPETLPVIADNNTLKSLNQQILKAEQHIMELSKKYGPKHPLMISARSDLDMLSKSRDNEIERIIKTIKNDYELAKTTEENLQALLSKTKADTVDLNERFIQYNILKREVETNRNLYESLVAKIKEQNVTEQIQTVDVWVVEEAKVPESPSKPNKPRNLMLGIVLGLFGGIGLAFFLEYLDNTIKLPEDIEERFNFPVLGVVPYEDRTENAGKEKIGEKEMEERLSLFLESFKSIRSSVLLSSFDAPPRSILVSGMSPQVGKTTTAVNLARAMSQAGKKVLLIDADLRRPQLHKVFKIDNSKGLSTCVAGLSDMKIIQKSRIENLDVITSGPIPPNPSELLGSDRFKSTLNLLVGKYDVTIVDSPPILSVSDSLLLSRVVDGTILVARSALSTYEAFHNGLKKLTDIKSKIFGIVINGVDMKKSGYYYQEQYHYYYSSEEE